MLEQIQKFIAKIISLGASGVEIFWSNFDLGTFAAWQIVLDVLLVAIIFYWILLFLRGTQAVPVLYGLVILGLFSFLAEIFDLVALSWLFEYLATILVIAIPIIFQPELRRFLEKLGRHSKFSFHDPIAQKRAIHEISEAFAELSKNKTGAIVAFAKNTSLKEFAESGNTLDAEVSADLIISIFQKTSPLHDGAAVLNKGKVVSAGAVLPLSVKSSSKKWGTRHKAALGLSEQSDAVVAVVSEERGEISLFHEGITTEGLTPEKMQIVLERKLLPHKKH